MGTYAKQKKEEKKQKKFARQAELLQHIQKQTKKKQLLNGVMIGVGLVVVALLFRGARTSSQTNPPTKDERRIAMETAACTSSLAGTTRYAGYGCYEYCNGKQREQKSGCSDSSDNSQDRSNQSCVGLPDNAQRNGADTIDQIWDGSKRYPTTTGRYNEGVSDGECTFSCKTNYTRKSNTCTADTRVSQACTGLLTNASRNTASNITQTWNGSTWIPSTTGSYNTTASTSECRFKCADNYVRDGSNCIATYPGCDTPDITIGSYTIAACNVGASTPTDYGYFFQRGNKYGFPNTGTINSTSPNQVNASGYGPSTYSSGTFILHYQRDNSDNKNLRGGSADESSNGYSGINYADRKGPCSDGYHVPSVGEWGGLLTVRHNANSHGGTYNAGGGLPYINNWSTLDLGKFQVDTKLPLAGYRDFSSASVNDKDKAGRYWSSSPLSNANYARKLSFNQSYLDTYDYDESGLGYSVRCFKNP